LSADTRHSGLALSHFLLAVLACLAIYAFPAAGLWPILLSVVPFGVRLFIDRPMFRYGLIDGLLAIFLVTALIGCWAAYDQKIAWIKLGLLISGILLYYAISTQPGVNLGLLAGFWFVFGVAVSLYFLLTLDFVASPAKFQFINQIGLKWMSIRPVVSWPAIQPSDTAAGIAIITSVYGLYFLAAKPETNRNKLVRILVLLGFGIVLAAVVLATSRGALVALAAVTGVLLAWLFIRRIGLWKENVYRFFPAGVLLFLGLTALLLTRPLGVLDNRFFSGMNLILSRSELIRNSISIMIDFPFWGGGLGSFPGLFSQYVLVIPYYSLLNSHNIFIDVGIEQGMIGGLAFLFIYSISLWKIAFILGRKHSTPMQIFYGCVFISIFIAVFHELVDDYLYSGCWPGLAFFPVGMSMLAAATEPAHDVSSRRNAFFSHSSEIQNLGSAKVYSHAILALLALVVAVCALNWNRIAAEWLANLGAVKMDKIELAGYPANKWDEGRQINELLPARMLFVHALQYDSGNWIANYRLGLIEMSERDFYSASDHLAKAYKQEPWHRGIGKNLAYSYAWLSKMDEARLFLAQIPEAKSELQEYARWWDTQGRKDLSTNANVLSSELKSSAVQH
jgi:hypothetical protein